MFHVFFSHGKYEHDIGRSDEKGLYVELIVVISAANNINLTITFMHLMK